MTTRYEHGDDADGRFEKVIDPYLFEATTHYNRNNQKDYTVDKNQTRTNFKHVTTWVYDDLGRVNKHTLPGGEFESFEYKPNGTVGLKTDFNGDVIDYTHYPCCGRLRRKTFEDGTYEAYTYTGTGRIDTFRNRLGEITGSGYDFRGRLEHVSRPAKRSFRQSRKRFHKHACPARARL